ncbi:MAG: aminotransferase class I/II-fold pyridoxal phosphate-dependent enzyme [bacterium]|nr:aminotransferase class I/II-fold pyridoxal phosphate-dependent enzyme [bacterium]
MRRRQTPAGPRLKKSSSPLSRLRPLPEDEIFGLQRTFGADPRPGKLNGAIGVYTDETGKPFVLPVVRQAFEHLQAANFNYLPIGGDPRFLELTAKLVFGEQRYGTLAPTLVAQGVTGGTNALSLFGGLARTADRRPTLIIGEPTWENHKKIFDHLGFAWKTFLHLTPAYTFNLAAALAALKTRRPSWVLLHGGATHNPTGVNPAKQEWQFLARAMAEYGHTACVDHAYTGLGDGLIEDSAPIHQLISLGVPTFVAVSFSKNMTLYQHRAGALLYAATTAKEKTAVTSHLEHLFRATNSNPPAAGELVVGKILSEPQLRQQWEGELAAMRASINERRTQFIKLVGEPYGYLERCRGLFSLLQLNAKRIRTLREQQGIYLLSSGRVNWGGIATLDLPRLAAAVRTVA